MVFINIGQADNLKGHSYLPVVRRVVGQQHLQGK